MREKTYFTNISIVSAVIITLLLFSCKTKEDKKDPPFSVSSCSTATATCGNANNLSDIPPVLISRH